MTLTMEVDLDSVKLYGHANYLGQMSFRLKL